MKPGDTATVDVVVVRKIGSWPNLGFSSDWNGFLECTIAQVEPDGPAARAGLKRRDGIESVAGRSTAALTEFGTRMLLSNQPPGTPFEIFVRRKDGNVRLTMIFD